MNQTPTPESLRQTAAAMEAFAAGKPIQYLSWVAKQWINCPCPKWTIESYEYRPTPEKTVRPWKPEEVPLGAIIQRKDNKLRRCLISVVTESHILSTSGTSTFAYVLENYTLANGQPCGVLEESA